MGSGGSEKPRAHYRDRDVGGIQNSNVGVIVAVGNTGSRERAIQSQVVEQKFWPARRVGPLEVSMQYAGFRTNLMMS